MKEWVDKLIFFDCEVFKYDWLFVFKFIGGDYVCFHNDPVGVSEFISEHSDYILCGYNNKFYDNYILKGVLNGLPISDIKNINDVIIGGGYGWEIPDINYVKLPVTTDLMSDIPTGLSLKEIEGNLGMNIMESSVDFNLDRALTKEEFDEVLKYCKHDVYAVEVLYEKRKDYLNSKVQVGELAGLSYSEVLGLTNAKLTALFLGAEFQVRNDENDYVIPDNVDLEKIPSEVIDFFNQLKYTDDTNVEKSEKLKIDIAGVPHVIGWGGLHGAIANYKEG